MVLIISNVTSLEKCQRIYDKIGVKLTGINYKTHFCSGNQENLVPGSCKVIKFQNIFEAVNLKLDFTTRLILVVQLGVKYLQWVGILIFSSELLILEKNADVEYQVSLLGLLSYLIAIFSFFFSVFV